MGGIFWLLILGVGGLLRRGSEKLRWADGAGLIRHLVVGGDTLYLRYIYRLNWDFGIDIFLRDYYNQRK